MDWTPVDPKDERRHESREGLFWGESWYYDFTSADGAIGGYVRLGLYPNQSVAWYWACLVREGEPLVTVIEQGASLPAAGSLQVRSEGLWADHTCEEPLDRWSLGLEAFGLLVDDPTEVYRPEPRGTLVPFGFELEWETDGTPFRYTVTDRYEIPCRVHGEILLGHEAIEFDGLGQRDHSWGERDWWQFGWVWSAFVASDGERLFGNWVPVAPEFTFTTGYRQGRADTTPKATDDFEATFTPTAAGLVADLGWTLDGVRAEVEPVSWSPVLLVSPEGRRSHFARALCRATLDDGRTAVGWLEVNQPEP